MTRKLNVSLGVREKVEKVISNSVTELKDKFKNKTSFFKGERKTYQPIEGYADEPSKRSFVQVASTVEEQIKWFYDTNKDYFDLVFAIEKTNASGLVKAELVVNGDSWGEYSSSELLRLKGVIETHLKAIYEVLPVRGEDQVWTETTDGLYNGRNIHQSSIDSGFAKTTLKSTTIINDPMMIGNIVRPPVTQEVSTQVNIGSYTSQNFTGCISMRKRAELIRKLDQIHTAIIEALGKANDVECIESNLGTKFVAYITA